MYIQKLILENFQFVNRVYHTKRIILDLSNRTSNICIIAGPNGSGKTFLLSSLTPFSNLGGVDVRDDSSPIEKGVNGFKEIEICNGNDIYSIQHYYSPSKNSHSVKSFIQKNGVEKNPNGNVTSFKSYISDELGITPNYMKLLRLGGNVKSLISAKATERKEIITEMLNNMNDTLDQILVYNKKTGDSLKAVKQVMSSISVQIDKLQVSSIDELNIKMSTLKERQSEYSNRLADVRKEKGALEYILTSIGDIEEIKESYREAKKQYVDIDRGMKTIPSDITLDEIEKDVKRLDDEITESSHIKDMRLTRRSNEMESLDDSISQKEELNQIIKRLSDSESEIKELIDLKNSLVEKCNKASSDYIGFIQRITVDEVKSIITIFSGIQSKLDVVYSFGDRPVTRVIELMNSSINVEDYIETNIIAYHIAEAEREHSSTIIRELTSIIDTAKPLECMLTDCPGRLLYNHIKEFDNRKINKPIEDSEFLNYMRHIYSVIKDVLNALIDNKDLISKLPIKISEELTEKKILKKISKRLPIYDIKVINTFLTYLTNYDIYVNDLKEIDRLKNEIDSKSKTNEYAYFKKQQEILEKSVDEHKKNIIEIDEFIDELDRNISLCKEKLEERNRWKDVILHKEELTDLINDLSSKIETYRNTKDKLKNDVEVVEKLCEEKIQYCNRELYELEYKKRSYINLTEQLEKEQNLFDTLNIIKKATSTKEGIPMYIMQVYLSKIKSRVNTLLSNGYAELKVSDFVLSADEFRIPYTVRDEYLVDDVSYASQGEQTFLGTALAIAISSMRYTLKKHNKTGYNVYYLDEVDGPLDIEKSSKWIEFLENIFQTANVEQAFVITHKNMFSSYLVDLIITDESFFSTGAVEDLYPLSNRIDIVKENE